MNLDERITLVEKQLQELSQKALDIPNTEVIKQLVVLKSTVTMSNASAYPMALSVCQAPTSCRDA
jgi:DNA replication protein DnaC